MVENGKERGSGVCSLAPRLGELLVELAVLDFGRGSAPVCVGDRVAHCRAHLIPACFIRPVGASLGGEVEAVVEEGAPVLDAVLDLGTIADPVLGARAGAAGGGVAAVRGGGGLDGASVALEEHNHFFPVVSVAAHAPAGGAIPPRGEAAVAVALILGEEVRVHDRSVSTGILPGVETNSASVHLLFACSATTTARPARGFQSAAVVASPVHRWVRHAALFEANVRHSVAGPPVTRGPHR